jgi:hypothetical protein
MLQAWPAYGNVAPVYARSIGKIALLLDLLQARFKLRHAPLRRGQPRGGNLRVVDAIMQGTVLKIEVVVGGDLVCTNLREDYTYLAWLVPLIHAYGNRRRKKKASMAQALYLVSL